MTLNPNPTVYATVDNLSQLREELRSRQDPLAGFDEEEEEEIDALEIFDLIRVIGDPEHPLTLEQLKVTQLDLVTCDGEKKHVEVLFTPTIPHCSMAQLIGLCIRVKLLRTLPADFKVDVHVNPGTHSSEDAVNKQLNDKERVAAALENRELLKVINGCIAARD